MDTQKITNKILEGSTFLEAVQLCEDQIDKNKIEDFKKSGTYEDIDDLCKTAFFRVENCGHRQATKTTAAYEEDYYAEWVKDPLKATRIELEDLEDALQYIEELSIKNYPTETYKKVATVCDSGARKVNSGYKALAKNHAQKPAFYSSYLLDIIKEVYDLLGVEFMYDYNWQSYLNDTKPSDFKGEVEFDKDGVRVIDYAVPEKDMKFIIHKAVSEELDYKTLDLYTSLDESCRQYVDKYFEFVKDVEYGED